MSAYQYVTLSRTKYELALYHAHQFRRVVDEFVLMALFLRPDGIRADAPVYVHSDGCVVQLYAAFDGLACAAGHQFGLAKPDRLSFKELKNHGVLRRLSAPFADSVLAVLDSGEYQTLDVFRNEAAHRTVLAQRIVYGTDHRTHVYLAAPSPANGYGDEAGPELLRLVRWARGPLLWMWNAAELWLGQHEISAKGTMYDIEISSLPKHDAWLTWPDDS